MGKPDYVDFQDRTKPLAYLITFRCYGTWLHGDERGSIDRRNYNRYGTPDMPANPKLLNEETAELKHRALLLSSAQNVRTNHVHSVVSAPCNPEHVMDSFKSYATRKLRETSLLDRSIKPWARHGSTPYLWTEDEVQRAIDYVLNGQGEEPFV